jgi:hypothetical protein
MLSRRLVLGFCVTSALLGCSNDKDSSGGSEIVPAVFIDAVFTSDPNSVQTVALPPDRAPLSEVSLGCDGRLGVRLAYQNWTPRAPGLCGATANCGHTMLTLTVGDRTSAVGVVASPGLLTLSEPSLWQGSASLMAELRNDDGTPHIAAGTPVRDEIELPLAAADCGAGAAAGAPPLTAGAGGSGGAP